VYSNFLENINIPVQLNWECCSSLHPPISYKHKLFHTVRFDNLFNVLISYKKNKLSEVYAAREKNGIYIPRDRYLQDEAEKKVHVLPYKC
jgi:hypothetical protein